MNSIDEFKKRLRDDESFKKHFKDVKSAKDVIKIAKKKGYDLTKYTEQDERELREDMLADVAGGSKTNEVAIAETSSTATGNRSSSTQKGKIQIGKE